MKLWLIKQIFNKLIDNKDVVQLIYTIYWHIIDNKVLPKIILNYHTYRVNLRDLHQVNKRLSKNKCNTYLCYYCNQYINNNNDYLKGLTLRYKRDDFGSLCYQCVYLLINN